ncbi:hypothetical protein PRZ48_006894 [Zasmidium cellare]|uniref:Uncharacterized protein n=1 Tax=Zasmidium cellare TaxID=395010 RepID=A0ABR0EIY7_ZASCE|nr:hypothetical protein PRZ48_006894 [Zasmidium cellare]
MFGFSNLLRGLWSDAQLAYTFNENRTCHGTPTSSTPTAKMTSIFGPSIAVASKGRSTAPSTTSFPQPKSMSNNATDEEKPDPEPPIDDPNASCPLFLLTGEVRNRIYAYATSYPGKIHPKTTPPLTLVSRLLHHEVPPIFHNVNTFHLSTPSQIARWPALRHHTKDTRLHIDLASSAAFGWTIRSYGLQPIKILKDEGEGLTVLWVSLERGVEMVAEGAGRKGVFLSIAYLAEVAYHGWDGV